MQDFESESLEMEVDHSQREKATFGASDDGSKDCVNLSSSTAVSRLNADEEFITPATPLAPYLQKEIRSQQS